MANAARARKARSGARLTSYTFGVLRRAGLKHKTTTGGRTTILGRGRAPRSVFPKARFKILRKLTY